MTGRVMRGLMDTKESSKNLPYLLENISKEISVPWFNSLLEVRKCFSETVPSKKNMIDNVRKVRM